MIALVLYAVLSQAEAPPAEELGEHFARVEPGSRWGAVFLAAGTVSATVGEERVDPLTEPRLHARLDGISGIAGVGVRYGLRARENDRMLMPAIAFVAGSAFQLDNFSPFAEARAELMSVTPGGLLQPNFLIYGTSGLSSTPLGLRSGFSVQPHFGLGLGWNWLPRGGGGGGLGSLGGLGSGGGMGLLVAIPVAIAITAMVFAGRIEVRYTARPLSGPGSDFVALMVGFGA